MPSSWACGEGLGDLDDLAGALVRSEVDRGADRRGAHVMGFLHRAEEHLVELVGVGQQLVVVDLDKEGDLVGVLAGDRAQHAVGAGDGVAAALDAPA